MVLTYSAIVGLSISLHGAKTFKPVPSPICILHTNCVQPIIYTIVYILYTVILVTCFFSAVSIQEMNILNHFTLTGSYAILYISQTAPLGCCCQWNIKETATCFGQNLIGFQRFSWSYFSNIQSSLNYADVR